MSDFRFAAVRLLRATTLEQICELARASRKHFSVEEQEALKAIAKVVTREILAKRQAEREREERK